MLGIERGELPDLFARELPFQPRKGRACVIGALRILHHLPESLETRILLSMKCEGRRREIGEQAEFISLGEDHFAGAGFLWQDLPRWCAIRRYRNPPMRGIPGIALNSGRVR